MRHLVNLIEDLRRHGIGFRLISDAMIDTTSASGDLIFHIFSALAQFERRFIQERRQGQRRHVPGAGKLRARDTPTLVISAIRVRDS